MAKIKISSILEEKGSTIHSITPQASVFEALTLMAEVNVGALVVMENDRIAGIISERDYARKVVLAGKTSLETKVSDIMSSNVISTTPEQTVDDAMAVMTNSGIRHLPVVEQDQLIGLVSIGDLVKAVISSQKIIIEQLESYIKG
ncbi:MAG: CBS domain-containing protein [Pseudomonadota bacterium]